MLLQSDDDDDDDEHNPLPQTPPVRRVRRGVVAVADAARRPGTDGRRRRQQLHGGSDLRIAALRDVDGRLRRDADVAPLGGKLLQLERDGGKRMRTERDGRMVQGLRADLDPRLQLDLRRETLPELRVHLADARDEDRSQSRRQGQRRRRRGSLILAVFFGRLRRHNLPRRVGRRDLLRRRKPTGSYRTKPNRITRSPSCEMAG
mmetsp:Transcript_9266/g.22741  ORF Transcript_9266/g.22741 Transcript_9266/m.22741 type:complete len:204 (+) Transcript_9266:194-805(+)